MPTPPTKNLSIYRGETWSHRLRRRELSTGDYTDFTGYTFAMDIRNNDIESGTLQIGLTAGNGRVSISTTTVTFTIAAADTDTLVAGRYYYDIKMTTPGGVVSFPVKGVVDVVDRVTD